MGIGDRGVASGPAEQMNIRDPSDFPAMRFRRARWKSLRGMRGVRGDRRGRRRCRNQKGGFYTSLLLPFRHHKTIKKTKKKLERYWFLSSSAEEVS
ncbi:hypothetical protein M5K25_017281 [Dendrobium thyrsiflorum]|uniref:Uncharacterized protein n=1 Tax=Dendrobium thyrsiflorum TaxID=117978 RepID=A0ABD0UTQ1_DENTH